MTDIDALRVEKNLFELYRLAGQSSAASFLESKELCAVTTEPFAWPNYIFYNAFNFNTIQNSIKEANRLISEENAPRFFINGPSVNDAVFEEKATGEQFRKLMQWPGMALDLSSIAPPSFIAENINYELVTNNELLDIWIWIAEQNLFKKKKLSIDLFRNFLTKSNIQMWLGYNAEQPVSTVLCHEFEKSVGIYMVSVLPEFRGKGIARRMIGNALNDSKSSGCNLASLQANETSYLLYKSMGFYDIGQFSIYWSMLPQK